MRIECDNCSARYSIADEKVIGKLYRVRCKKCGHMIMVDGTQLAPQDEGEEATRVFDMNAAAHDAQSSMSDGGGDAVWYIVIDGAETGPLNLDEVEEQIRSGAVDGDTLGWCEGMANWEPLASIDAFGGIFAMAGADFDDDGGYEDEATRVVDTSSDERTFNFGGASATAAGMQKFPTGGFATAKPAPAPAPAPAPVSFEAPRPTATSGAAEAVFATSATSAPASGGAGGGGGLGARNENSVLFSLSELTSGSDSKPKDELPRTEASGLIDIRVLSSTMAMPAMKGPDAGAGGGGPSPMMGSPVPLAPLIPVQPRRTSPALIGGIAVGVLAIIGLLVALIVVMMKEEPVPVVAAAPPAPAEQVAAAAPTETPSAPEAAAAAAEEPAAAPTVDAGVAAEGSGEAVAEAPSEEPAAGEAPAAAQEPTRTAAAAPATTTTRTEAAPTREVAAAPSRDTTSTRDADRSGSTSRTADTRTAAAPTATATDRDRPRGDDAVNSALSAIRRNQDPPAEASRPARPSGQTQQASRPAAQQQAAAAEGLGRAEVQNTIRRYGSRISACRTSPDQEGTYRVRFIIQPSGSVTNAQAEDRGDVGRCLVSVVRDMSFPSFRGDPQTVTYPFRI